MARGEGFREIEPTVADEEAAEEILESIEDALERIHPARVMFSTLVVLIVTLLLLGSSLWIVPYDGVTVDVVYRQSGGGHIVLVELDNRGSRSMEDIEMSIRMVDDVGIEIGRTDFEWDQLGAHTSIAHDDLELVIDGASVWEKYVIEIDLEYQSYGGEKEEDWSIDVGDWTSEYHLKVGGFTFF
jgi:hypothetical protein